MLHLFLLICGSCKTDAVRSIAGASLLACPSSFPASSGTYSDCSISGITSRGFSISLRTLTLNSCTFTNCTDSGGDGGCIYSATGISIYIYSCSFTNCTCSGAGGCIFAGGVTSVYSSSFTECKSGYGYIGGAIACCGQSNTLTLADSVIDRCCGGSTVCFRSTAVTISQIRNCSFTSCTANGSGGGIDVNQRSSSSKVTVTDCTFVSCTQTFTLSYYGGGAIEVGGGGTVNINYCFIDSCAAATHGGGIYIYDVSSVVVFESEIRKCSAVSSGGGIACCTSISGSPSLTISYLTITDCTANSSYGQAIHIFKCKSFKWDHLCITGSVTLVKSEISSISVPTAQELVDGCPPATPSRSPTRSRSQSQSRSPSASASQSRSPSPTMLFTQQGHWNGTISYPFRIGRYLLSHVSLLC